MILRYIFLGFVELPPPYQEYVIDLDIKCPAALINDPGDVNLANVYFELVDQAVQLNI